MSGDVVAAQVWSSTVMGTLLNLPHRRTSEAQSLPCDFSQPYANTWQPGLSSIITFSLVAPMKFWRVTSHAGHSCIQGDSPTVPWALRGGWRDSGGAVTDGSGVASCHFLWLPTGCKASEAMQVTQWETGRRPQLERGKQDAGSPLLSIYVATRNTRILSLGSQLGFVCI